PRRAGRRGRACVERTGEIKKKGGKKTNGRQRAAVGGKKAKGRQWAAEGGSGRQAPTWPPFFVPRGGGLVQLSSLPPATCWCHAFLRAIRSLETIIRARLGGLRHDPFVPKKRALWTHIADSPRCVLGRGKHRRGVCKEGKAGVRSLPRHRSRLAHRAGGSLPPRSRPWVRHAREVDRSRMLAQSRGRADLAVVSSHS